jgi:two-component system response regulator AtoC
MEGKGRVLVVDDDAGILTFAVLALVREGYSVVVAPNGIVALNEMEKFCPDVVMLDMMMPGMNGMSFLDAYQAMTDCAPPVIVMSAVAQDKSELMAKGVRDFLAKPFDLHNFLALVEKYVKDGE